MEDILKEDEPDQINLECALRLDQIDFSPDTHVFQIPALLIHQGEFSYDQLEVSTSVVGAPSLYKQQVGFFDPGETQALPFNVGLTSTSILRLSSDGSPDWYGFQIQFKTTDIIEDVAYYRTPCTIRE